MKAVNLKVDYLKTPLGLGNNIPRFFWNCEGGVKQTAYRIVCMRNDVAIWDSGMVTSSSMTHVKYEGQSLASRDIVYWTVQLWDENGVEGEICGDHFEIGLLTKNDWTAKWIVGDYKPNSKLRYPVDCFKKTFTVSKKVEKARLYATSRGIYDVSINGRRIEEFILAPGITDYKKRIQVQTYDITDDICNNNVVEFRLADGWFRGSVAAYGVTNAFGTQTSLLAQIEITYSDGSAEIIGTDDSFSWSNDGPIRFADLKDGEVYNASMKPSYRGKAKIIPEPANVLLTNSNNVNVTEHECFSPTLLPGKVLDFGQNIAGYLEFKVKGQVGQHIRIVCSELYDETRNAIIANAVETKPVDGWTQQKLIKKLLTGNIKGETVTTPLQEIIFICSGEEDHYKTSFSIFGFRYAQIFSEVEIIPKNFEAIAVYSDLEQTGDFECSDERVNQLFRNTKWSMKGNFLDVPTDCPTRERLGWTGDAQVFFDTGAYLMNTAPFFAKWLRDMEDSQYKNGLIPAVIPLTGVEMMYKATGSSVGWADAIYLIPYRYYKRFGDKDILVKSWPMMEKYAEYLLKNLEKDGHYEKGVQLGEWLEPEEFRDKVYGAKAKHPEECTAYLYLTMTIMEEIAAILDKPTEKYNFAAKRAKEIYLKYAELDTDRQAKLVRPLALGLVEDCKEAVQARLVKAVEKYNHKVGTGFLSTPFLLKELTKAGASETAYKVLLNEEKPGWLYEVSQGATTVWETWEGYTGKGDSGSLNHYSPGAVCQWLFDSCAGINVVSENHFVIKPVPGGTLNFARANYKSIYGEVSCGWKKTEKGTCFSIKVPENCTADIIMPDGRKDTISSGEYEYV